MNLYRSSLAGASSVAPSKTSAISSSASASASAATKLTSLGCYQDGTTRIFDGPTRRDAQLTPDSCAAWCVAQGYPVIGLEDSSQVSMVQTRLIAVLLRLISPFHQS